MSIALNTLADYLNAYFDVARFKDDQIGVYHPSMRPVQRIGLALEPWPDLPNWVRQERLDALFLHRPWHLAPHALPQDIGILAYHLAFDLNLTFGFNTRLAQTLQMYNLVPFAPKDGVPLGMTGDIRPLPLSTVMTILHDTFGTPPQIGEQYCDTVSRLAIVGSMTDILIREAASRDVQLYITGQWRKPAAVAVDEMGMTVALIGHTTGELWGLRALAGILRERWSGLEVMIAPHYK